MHIPSIVHSLGTSLRYSHSFSFTVYPCRVYILYTQYILCISRGHAYPPLKYIPKMASQRYANSSAFTVHPCRVSYKYIESEVVHITLRYTP